VCYRNVVNPQAGHARLGRVCYRNVVNPHAGHARLGRVCYRNVVNPQAGHARLGRVDLQSSGGLTGKDLNENGSHSKLWGTRD